MAAPEAPPPPAPPEVGMCMALWKKSLMRVWEGGDDAHADEVDGWGSVVGMIGGISRGCLTNG